MVLNFGARLFEKNGSLDSGRHRVRSFSPANWQPQNESDQFTRLIAGLTNDEAVTKVFQMPVDLPHDATVLSVYLFGEVAATGISLGRVDIDGTNPIFLAGGAVNIELISDSIILDQENFHYEFLVSIPAGKTVAGLRVRYMEGGQDARD